MDVNHTEGLPATSRSTRRSHRLRRVGAAAVVTMALVGGAIATAGNAAALPNNQQCIAYFKAYAVSDLNLAAHFLAEATTDDALGNYTAAVTALDNYRTAIGSYSASVHDESLC
jgi:hypothetical protein